MLDANAIKHKLILNGHAMVHVIEGLEILKEDSGSWQETLLLNLTLDLYRHRLNYGWEEVPLDIRDGILRVSKTNMAHR